MSDSEKDAVSIGSNSSSNGSAGSSSSSSSVQSANHAPYKYKRRRRVYDRLKQRFGGGGGGGTKYKSLATVPEGEALKHSSSASSTGRMSWLGPKIVGIFVVLMIVIAGLKEGIKEIRIIISGGEPNDSTESDMLRRRKEDDSEEDAEGEDFIPDIDVMPEELNFLASTYEPLQANDRAFFWHVPRSGGASVKSIAAQCIGLLMATEAGAAHSSDQIKIITDIDGGKFVNVDTTNPAGIDHAQSVNVANLAGLNFISTPFLYEASQKLFGDLTRGRMFTMMRHPVDRAASLYYVLASDPNNGVLIPGESLEDFAKSDRVEKNWMTRFLSNGQEESMSMDNVAVAKQVLKHKCLVGLLKLKGESLRRFETFFGWTIDGEKTEDCHSKMLDWNWPNKNKHPPVREGTETWRLLMKNNELDMKLYKYAEELFQEQGLRIFPNGGANAKFLKYRKQ